jgi:hypothetical protein
VRPTAQLQVSRIGRAAIGKRDHVVILQESSLRASACGADERTLSTVAGPDLAFHGGSDVPAGVRDAMFRARVSRGSVPGLAQFREQQRQCSIEDLGHIPRRHLVPEQSLSLSQLFVHRTRCGEFD